MNWCLQSHCSVVTIGITALSGKSLFSPSCSWDSPFSLALASCFLLQPKGMFVQVVVGANKAEGRAQPTALVNTRDQEHLLSRP